MDCIENGTDDGLRMPMSKGATRLVLSAIVLPTLVGLRLRKFAVSAPVKSLLRVILGIVLFTVVIASSGATFAIHIGSWETIPFSLTHTSKITGSFTASAPINFLVMNSTQMDLLVHGGEPPYTGANALSYGVGTVYEVTHVTSFVFDVTLASGDYFLVFSCECGIVSIHITSSIIARTNPSQ